MNSKQHDTPATFYIQLNFSALMLVFNICTCHKPATHRLPQPATQKSVIAKKAVKTLYNNSLQPYVMW